MKFSQSTSQGGKWRKLRLPSTHQPYSPLEWHKDCPLAETPAGFHTVVGGKPMHHVHLTRDTVADESRVKFLLCVEEIQAMPKA